MWLFNENDRNIKFDIFGSSNTEIMIKYILWLQRMQMKIRYDHDSAGEDI